MIKFLLALFISTASFAAQPGAVPSVTVSASGANTAQVSISPSQLNNPCGSSGSSACFSLYMGYNFGTANYISPLYFNGAAYHVGANSGGSTTVKAYCFDITAAAGTGSYIFQLISASASFSQGVAYTALSGQIYQAGAPGNYVDAAGPTANVMGVVPGVYTFAANSYPGVQAAAAAYYQVHMDCYEQ